MEKIIDDIFIIKCDKILILYNKIYLKTIRNPFMIKQGYNQNSIIFYKNSNDKYINICIFLFLFLKIKNHNLIFKFIYYSMLDFNDIYKNYLRFLCFL